MHLLRSLLTLILVSFSSTSCAALERDNWSEWSLVDVLSQEREWRFCSKDLDGTEFDKKGFCYSAKECRYRTTIFNNTKTECRPILFHCKWGDINCLMENNILPMTIKNR